MTKNTFLLNPYNNNDSFGVIPYIKHGKNEFPEGVVKLRQGKHSGPNRGFGAVHIWEEHKIYLKRKGYDNSNSVQRFIADIIKSGSPIYCEFENLKGNHRIAVVRSTLGIAILEKIPDGNNNIFYSIVTAFEKKYAHGTKIGTVC